ncbi:uncharacterized protein LOC106866326 [Brachypodium distachyon]|uniref:uncharacterized protein LOC106866326 n=1 Tax=Brachypodium distachyon TaxID=15368 RepID=UPI000D0CFACA|nr:uncharacterized protein LOC106866326 [Brachypodium distachyon]|eukprot:XP_024317120.1 uncharacterized protein LOC106866326 [Brachypodium distachyon]
MPAHKTSPSCTDRVNAKLVSSSSFPVQIPCVFVYCRGGPALLRRALATGHGVSGGLWPQSPPQLDLQVTKRVCLVRTIRTTSRVIKARGDGGVQRHRAAGDGIALLAADLGLKMDMTEDGDG